MVQKDTQGCQNEAKTVQNDAQGHQNDAQGPKILKFGVALGVALGVPQSGALAQLRSGGLLEESLKKTRQTSKIERPATLKIELSSRREHDLHDFTESRKSRQN